MRQYAPDPEILKDLIGKLTYKRGWGFSLIDMERGKGEGGLTLEVTIVGPDTYHPEISRGVRHFMPVPPASYNKPSWRRWLFEQILLIERHETCEWFKIENERPYAPNHGPGWDPYVVTELTTDEDRRTSFRGVVKDK